MRRTVIVPAEYATRANTPFGRVAGASIIFSDKLLESKRIRVDGRGGRRAYERNAMERYALLRTTRVSDEHSRNLDYLCGTPAKPLVRDFDLISRGESRLRNRHRDLLHSFGFRIAHK